MPNIELETFDYTGRNMKKKSPSVTREEEVKVAVDQGSSKKEVNEGEVEGLCLRFARMRSTEKSSLIQVRTSEPEANHDDRQLPTGVNICPKYFKPSPRQWKHPKLSMRDQNFLNCLSSYKN